MRFRNVVVFNLLAFLLNAHLKGVFCLHLDDDFHGCAVPHVNATVGNFTSCKLSDVPKELNRCRNLTYLDLSRNFLSTPNLDFSMFPKLVRIDLSYNTNLGHSNMTGFIIQSQSVRILDLSHSGFGIIQPSSLRTPKLRHLTLTGERECEETRKLFRIMKPRMKVICAGTAPNPMIPKSQVSSTTVSPFYSQPATNTHVLNLSEEVTNPNPITSPHSPTSTTTFPPPPANPQNTTTSVSVPSTNFDEYEYADQYPIKHIVRLVIPILLVAIFFLALICSDETILICRRILKLPSWMYTSCT